MKTHVGIISLAGVDTIFSDEFVLCADTQGTACVRMPVVRASAGFGYFTSMNQALIGCGTQ